MQFLRRFSLPMALFTSITLIRVEQAQARVRPTPIAPASRAVMDNGCANRSNGITWTFRWTEPILGVTRYHLYVVGANAQNPVINQTDITSAVYTSRSPGSYIAEQNRRGWRWRVRALLNNQFWTDWSDESSFDVEPLNTDCR
jgi:hypothetical protein